MSDCYAGMTEHIPVDLRRWVGPAAEVVVIRRASNGGFTVDTSLSGTTPHVAATVTDLRELIASWAAKIKDGQQGVSSRG